MCWVNGDSAMCWVNGDSAMCWVNGDIVMCWVNGDSAMCWVNGDSVMCWVNGDSAMCWVNGDSAMCVQCIMYNVIVRAYCGHHRNPTANCATMAKTSNTHSLGQHMYRSPQHSAQLIVPVWLTMCALLYPAIPIVTQ